jgi:hypothetical protein
MNVNETNCPLPTDYPNRYCTTRSTQKEGLYLVHQSNLGHKLTANLLIFYIPLDKSGYLNNYHKCKQHLARFHRAVLKNYNIWK